MFDLAKALDESAHIDVEIQALKCWLAAERRENKQSHDPFDITPELEAEIELFIKRDLELRLLIDKHTTLDPLTMQRPKESGLTRLRLDSPQSVDAIVALEHTIAHDESLDSIWRSVDSVSSPETMKMLAKQVKDVIDRSTLESHMQAGETPVPAAKKVRQRKQSINMDGFDHCSSTSNPNNVFASFGSFVLPKALHTKASESPAPAVKAVRQRNNKDSFDRGGSASTHGFYASVKKIPAIQPASPAESDDDADSHCMFAISL